ncbi:MAG: HD domain-containing protein [Nitrospirae bacterium]|nr:MAG: HD domain-containing protein [Nitrospirota bacterium]
MRSEDLSRFKTWFSDFCRSYYTNSEEDNKNIRLKEDHTKHVCSLMADITSSLGLDENRSLIAQTTALFHDVGRFPQYKKYKTFKDSASTNHGALGAETLIEHDALSGIPADEMNQILTAVKFHNAYTLADIADPEALLQLKLVRDADKIDIWKLFYLYYVSAEEERPSAVALGLADRPEYSERVLSCIFNKQLARLADLTTLNDFKLLKLTWLFDLNFKISFKIFAEKDYLGLIVSTLPQTDGVFKARDFLEKYIKEKLETI